ncbi:MAG TPA: sigma-70 family RNA polymerase sigma factor [Vicinamibacterales bacterium]
MTADPSTTFEPHRARLLGLAYRMLGSMTEAEDAVQEAYLRWHAADRSRIDVPRAFLMTTTTRICLDVLKSARARREEYVGPWLPDPVIDTSSLAPDAQTELAEDLSIALLLALESLSPLERAAFLLHDVFDYSFAQIADALGRNEAACRQLATRARTHVRARRPSAMKPRPASTIDPRHRELLSAFIHATRSGDLATLTRLLASDAKVVTDGGGKVAAALNVIEGRERSAAFLIGATRKGWRDEFLLRFDAINGLPGIVIDGPTGVVQTNGFEIEDGVVRAIYIVRNPDKLRHLTA